MAKLTVTNNNDVAVRFFDGSNEVDIAPGATSDIEVANGSVVIDMIGTPEATMESFRRWQEQGSLGG